MVRSASFPKASIAARIRRWQRFGATKLLANSNRGLHRSMSSPAACQSVASSVAGDARPTDAVDGSLGWSDLTSSGSFQIKFREWPYAINPGGLGAGPQAPALNLTPSSASFGRLPTCSTVLSKRASFRRSFCRSPCYVVWITRWRKPRPRCWRPSTSSRRRVWRIAMGSSAALEAIVALPQQLFYNTGIGTYIWLLSNRKPAAHNGKVMLVDASCPDFWSGMSKSLGSKRREITETHKQAVLKLVKARKAGPFVKIFDTTDFGYREIKVLRPLKLRFTVHAESLARLDTQSAFKNLAVSKKKAAAEQKHEEKEGLALQAEIRAALQTLAGKTYLNREKFTAALEAALKKAGLKLKAPVLKAILAGIGERDDTAEICR
ncbi:MAG: SAM-dependent DNA methyltransferase, partial [Planctomycetota bacterium]